MITPKPVSKADLAFGPTKIGEFLPPYSEVPNEFKRHHGNKWVDLVNKWFFEGLDKDIGFYVVEGVDAKQALVHVAACLRSWEPKHEHKIAGCAYLMSQWFTGYDYGKADKE